MSPCRVVADHNVGKNRCSAIPAPVLPMLVDCRSTMTASAAIRTSSVAANTSS